MHTAPLPRRRNWGGSKSTWESLAQVWKYKGQPEYSVTVRLLPAATGRALSITWQAGGDTPNTVVLSLDKTTAKLAGVPRMDRHASHRKQSYQVARAMLLDALRARGAGLSLEYLQSFIRNLRLAIARDY